MKALNKLNSDLTFRQDTIPKHVNMLGLELFSSDMSAFTDRFPRVLEKSVVEIVHGSQMAERWDFIIADRYFGSTALNGSIKYKVGNPMGILSS
jgi:hypothetical protein